MEWNSRIQGLDALRGLSILLMITFHFCFDLYYFGLVQWNMTGPFWTLFRGIIMVGFLGSAGYSMALAHKGGMNWPKYIKRLLHIGLGALAVTLGSFVTTPDFWIYFGILHFFFIASILSLAFIGRPKLALATGIIMLGLYHGTPWFNTIWLYEWLQPMLRLPTGTMDLTRLIPWFPVVLFGISTAYFLPNIMRWPQLTTPSWLCFLGRHSLLAYLIHQPILFGLTWLVSQVV